MSPKVACLPIQRHFDSTYSLEVDSIILPKLSSYKLPVVGGISNFKYLRQLKLSDPMYFEPSRIYILSASVYAQIIESQIVKGQSLLQPIALSSKLGWPFTGNLSSSPPRNRSDFRMWAWSQTFGARTRFWRAEDKAVDKKSYSPDEQACEEFYQKTSRQDETDRYIVSLPWKNRENPSSAHVENLHSVALRALNRLVANFAKDGKLKIAYIEFIKEYIDLGHMSLSSNFDSLSKKP